MRVTHISTFDRGGAAVACLRLHSALLKAGIVSRTLVKHRSKEYPEVYELKSSESRARRRIAKLLYHAKIRRHPSKTATELFQDEFKNNLPEGIEFFSFPDSGIDLTNIPEVWDADIVHLHWVSGFLDYPSFFSKIKKPVVWTLHDMEPFQGGTHYEEKFFGLTDLGQPKAFVIPSNARHVIERNVRIKTRALAAAENLSIVGPSKWLMNRSKNSQLLGRFHHHHIPYGLNSEIFKPQDKHFCKHVLGLPPEKLCLLFVSDKIETYRKGFEFLKRALLQIDLSGISLCAIGSTAIDNFNGQIHYLGRIDDERLMSVAYSAADAFIIPSVEDNLPNTVLEALLCGTPVIGFPTGGIPDMIEDGFNGFLCEEISVSSLIEAINKYIEQPNCFDSRGIRQAALKKYDETVQAGRYIDLYQQLMVRRLDYNP